MQSNGHAAVIARDSSDSKALFGRSLGTVDFLRGHWNVFLAMDFAEAGTGCCRKLESDRWQEW
jgi:hypothetical protein